MTISSFANNHRATGWDTHGQPIGRLYREDKRLAAAERQAAFDAEVQTVAREQNCHVNDARDVVNGRRRLAQRRAKR